MPNIIFYTVSGLKTFALHYLGLWTFTFYYKDNFMYKNLSVIFILNHMKNTNVSYHKHFSQTVIQISNAEYNKSKYLYRLSWHLGRIGNNLQVIIFGREAIEMLPVNCLLISTMVYCNGM